MVLPRNQNKTTKMPLAEVEKLFGFTYRSSLTFPSYDEFVWTLRQCPYLLRSARVAEENHSLYERYCRQVEESVIPPASIRWINAIKNYGLVADQDIALGAFLGEYVGLVRRLSRLHKDVNAYCFHYPTKLWSLHYCAIDALKYGNIMRFANHDIEGNMIPQCLVDGGLLHTVFFASREITAGEELTFNYFGSSCIVPK
jgi:hypothetical protein